MVGFPSVDVDALDNRQFEAAMAEDSDD